MQDIERAQFVNICLHNAQSISLAFSRFRFCVFNQWLILVDLLIRNATKLCLLSC